MSDAIPDDATPSLPAVTIPLEALPVPSIFCGGVDRTRYAANSAFRLLIDETNDWDAAWWLDSADPESREILVPLLKPDADIKSGAIVGFRKRSGDMAHVSVAAYSTPDGLLLCFSPVATVAPASPVAATSDPTADPHLQCKLMDLLPVGILNISSRDKGEITFCNHAVETMLGLKREQVVGHNYTAALSGNYLLKIRKLISQASSATRSQRLDGFPMVGIGGIRRILDISVESVATGSGNDRCLLLFVMDATERHREMEERSRISEALMCREENYRMLTDNSSDLITRHGYDGIVLFASNASRAMLDLEPGELTGRTLDEFVHVDDRAQFKDFITNMRMGGETASIVCRIIRTDQKIMWVETRATAIRGKRGGIELTCVTRDVSERKLSEDRLRSLQNQFSDAIENMDAGIVMYDADDRLVFCNKLYRNFYPSVSSVMVPGITYSEILDAFIAAGAAVDSGSTSEEFRAQRMKDHCARKGRRRLQCLGGLLWLQVTDHPTHDGGVVSLLTDVTALKHAQDELVRQRLMLSSLLDAIPDLITYKNIDGTYIACNPSFCEFAGLERDMIIGRKDADIFDTYRASVLNQHDEKAIKDKDTFRNEEWVNYPDGRRMRLETLRTPMLSPEGTPIGLVGISRNTTDRHTAEILLKAESMRLSTLIRSLEGGVMVMDQQRRIILVNEGFISILRLDGTPAEYVGVDAKTLMARILPSFLEPQTLSENLKHVFEAGKSVRDGVFAMREDYFTEYDFIPIDIGQGQMNYLWHFRDITTRRRAEIDLQQRDTLLSGLAQTVRQLLAGLESFDESITDAFRTVAETADIERIIIFQNTTLEGNGTRWTASHRYRWSRALGAAKELPEYSNMPFDPDFSRWYKELSRGVILAGFMSEFPEKERKFLLSLGFGSILVAPMFIEGRFWGFMIFDSKPDRVWSSSDRGILRMVADSIGMALQRKSANDKLNSALAQAERLAVEAYNANQAKTDFLASMSHEIRTPLNGVVGYSNLLRNTQLTSRQAELLRGIDRSSVMLLALINDILDLSKISAGQLTLDALPFCPAFAVEDAIAALMPRAAEKGLRILCDVKPDARQVFIGDERRLKQVILNLLGNAIKFTETGSVTVSVRVNTGDNSENVDGQFKMDFSVTDTGIGIDAENLDKLFRPFSQAQSDISRRFGGTGLGLAICKKLVEMMSGRIWVNSTPRCGSTFSFFIMTKLADEHVDVPEYNVNEPVGNASIKSQLTVLVADDNVINQEVLSMYIEELGFTPEIVADGNQAFEAVKDHQIDLILMDLRMPGMDGMQATQAIREWENTQLPDGRRPTRIVALTADAVKSDSEKCKEMGMDGYLTKPIDPDQIDRVIRQFFN